MFFRGRTTRNLDPKGRVMLSPEFREIVCATDSQGRLVLSTYDDCLVGFPMPEWADFEAKIMTARNPSRILRDFKRLVVGGAEIITLDAQGRARLSREHMQYAKIDREAVIVGQGKRFEIWSPASLAPVLNQNFDQAIEELAETGIDFGF